MTAQTLELLRRELASALVAAQGMPAPRDELSRMIYCLLLHAFTCLDSESGVEPERAMVIGAHALSEWRRYLARAGTTPDTPAEAGSLA